MAEYAGLTIRIGGDSKSLTAALKAPTKSAADLQSRIRQITQAMRFDPTSLSNIDTRIRITGERMQTLQAKTQIAKTAMQQLGDTVTRVSDGNGGFKTVRQLAEDTANLSLEAERAKQRFVDLRDQLAKMYETWNRAARAEGVDLMGSLSITKEDARRLMSAETSLSEFRREISLYNEQRKHNAKLGPIISQADIDRLVQLKTINFHGMFEEGTSLASLIQQARDLGVVIEDDVVESVLNMRTSFIQAQGDMKDLGDANAFERMGVEVQRFESEVEDLSRTMRTFDDGLTEVAHSTPFQNLESRLRTVDTALDNVNDDLERTEEALKLDPGNIDLAVRRFEDLQQVAELCEERASILRREIGLLDATGAEEAAQGHRDLATWIEESAEAARTAQRDLANQRATVQNLSGEIRELSEHIDMLGSSSATASMSDSAQRYQKLAQELEKHNKTLESTIAQYEGYKAKLASLQEAYDKAAADMDRYGSELDQLKSKLVQAQEAAEAAERAGDDTAWATAADDVAFYAAAIDAAKAKFDQAQRDWIHLPVEIRKAKEAVDEFGKLVGHVQSDVDRIKTSMSALEKTRDIKAFRDFPGTIEESREELARLEGQLTEATAEEKRLSEAYDAARSVNELAKTAKKSRELNAELAETEGKAKVAKDALEGLDLGSIIEPSTLKSIGMTMSATVTPVITGIGRAMLDASGDVDSAYRDMRKTVQGTEEDFERLKSAAIDFSRTHVTSADQILDIMAIGGELGIATENLETFAEVISNLSVATNLDTEGAATALGHLSNVLQLTEEDYVGFSDALVRLGNNGASTETEIADIAERIGSMGSIVGMSASDILAWASSIASTGQNAEAAGTAIAKTMSFFETAVSAAGGTIDASFDSINAAVQEGGDRLTVFASLMGQTADEFTEAWDSDPQAAFSDVTEAIQGAKNSLQMIADVAHMTADDFAKAWESDPTAAMEAFIKGLNDIEGAGGSADAVLQNLGIKAVRQKQAIEGLMQTIGGLDDNLRMSDDAWNGVSDQWGEAGDAANEAAKKAEGFSGQIEILKNKWQIFLSELGEGAAPWIQQFSGWVDTLSTHFSSLSTETKKWIVAAGGILAVTGPILTVVSTVGTAKDNFLDWLDVALSATSVVKSAFATGGEEAVEAMMGTMTTMDKMKAVGKDLGLSLLKGLSVAAVVAGVVAIGTAIKEAYDNWQTHIKATAGLSVAIKGIGKAAENASAPLGTYSSNIGRYVVETEDYEDRLAHLADTISESNEQYGDYSAKMDYYGDVIRELGGKADLSRAEFAKLSAAVQGVNAELGTNYTVNEYGEIIDATTGKVEHNTDAILNNIEARKQQALIDFYADDYAEALQNYAEAQARVNELQEHYSTLMTEEGHQAYVQEHLDNGSARNATEAEYQYTQAVEGTARSLADARTELEATDTALANIEAQQDIARAKMDESTRAMEEAARAQEEFDNRVDTVTKDTTGNMSRLSKAVSDVGKGDEAFNSIAEGLESIHVYADELDNVNMDSLVAAFDDMDGSMADVIATLENAGVSTKTWHAALDEFPEAAERMSSLSATAFDSLYEAAGQDLTATMELIAGLDEMEVKGKTFFIGDDGTIMDEEGRIYDLQRDLADIPEEVITKLAGDDTDLRDKLLDDQRRLRDIGNTTALPTVGIRDYASAKLDYLESRLSTLANKRYNTTVTATTQATGGMNNRPVIPRHASGYIATGPTLTNQGWIGEDGIEAVANWATGGAVVPLTNRKYMLPIADAIAEGMASRGGTGGDTYNLYINDARVNDDAEIQAALLGLLTTMKRRGAMDRG